MFRTSTIFGIVAGLALVAAPIAKAQTGLPPQLSDELQILSVTGAPIFDNFIPEPTSESIPEAPLVFTPGNPNPDTLKFDPGVAMTNGAMVTLLLDPAGEPVEPGEIPIPITLPTGGTAFLSDAIVSTLNVPAAFPPQVALFSDPSPFLQEIANDLPNAVLPPQILTETGSLQVTDLGNNSAAGQFGVGGILVASDIDVPEPATLALAGIAAFGLLRRHRRTA